MLVSNGKARSFKRRLDVHAVVDKVGYILGMRERLVGPAHDAEPNMHVTALHKGRNDGMKRTLARLESVGVRAVKRKQRATVLQGKSHSIDDYARTKAGVVALDERSNVAVFIDYGKIGGITGRGISRTRIAVRPIWVGSFGRVGRLLLLWGGPRARRN